MDQKTDATVPQLRWGLPKGRFMDGRVSIGNQTKERKVRCDFGDRFDCVRISKTLHISSLALEDMGRYTCTAVIGRNGLESTPSSYVLRNILLDRKKAFIGNVTFNGHPVIDNVGRDDETKWIFTVPANPDPTFTWLNPSGEEIDYGWLEKYEMDVDADRDQIKLVINNPTLRDTGEYIFNIGVRGMSEEDEIEKNVSLVLRYHQPPQLNLMVEGDERRGGEEHPLRILNEAYNLSCEAEGFPLDTATSEWTFKACSSYSNCFEPTRVEPDSLSSTDDNLNGDYHWQYTSRLHVVANASGIFTCKMCTADSDAPLHLPRQCNESNVNFFVTDFSTGFDVEAEVIEENDTAISVSDGSVIEKDEVQLTCAASIYEFADVTWYKIEDGYPETIKFRPLRRSGPKVHSYKSNFSIISRVTFSEIEESDEGMYECYATPRSASYSERRNKTYEVAVLEMIAPEKGPFFNIDKSEAVFNTGDSLDLNCTVNPDARPKPTITWTKDGNSSTLYDDSSIQWLNEGQRMRIKYLVHVHSGFYQCQARLLKAQVAGLCECHFLFSRVPPNQSAPKQKVAARAKHEQEAMLT